MTTVSFSGGACEVQVTAETYFEVKPNKMIPFQVGEQVIEDLSTKFNVNVYADKPEIKTTLVKGRITVNLQC
jgi:transmembrane sensor